MELTGGEKLFKVLLDRPFGFKIAGSTFGSFVAIIEEKGCADIWNLQCEQNEFDRARRILPGDALVGFTTSSGQRYSCKGKTHAEVLEIILEKLPESNITVEFRRMEGQERIDFLEWKKRFSIPDYL